MNCAHEHHTVLNDSGDIGHLRVMDVHCHDCSRIVGAIEHTFEARRREFHELSKVYLKRRHKVPCTCAENCGSYFCRKAA